MSGKSIGSILGLSLIMPTICLADEQCSSKTLQGRYVFAGRGFIEAADPGVQRVHYGLFNFNGIEKMSVKQSSSRGGKIGHENFEGTYTLNADCSGTITFGSYVNPKGQTHWDVYVTKDGTKGQMIRTDEGNMAVRSFER